MLFPKCQPVSSLWSWIIELIWQFVPFNPSYSGEVQVVGNRLVWDTFYKQQGKTKKSSP